MRAIRASDSLDYIRVVSGLIPFFQTAYLLA
jgi:hypothetical protein